MKILLILTGVVITILHLLAGLNGALCGIGGNCNMFSGRFSFLFLAFAGISFLGVILFSFGWIKKIAIILIIVSIIMTPISFVSFSSSSNRTPFVASYLEGLSPEACLNLTPVYPWGYPLETFASPRECMAWYTVEFGAGQNSCEQLPLKEDRDYCMSNLSGFSSGVVCDQIADQNLRDICIVQTSKKALDYENCAKVVDQNARNLCYNNTAMKVGHLYEPPYDNQEKREELYNMICAKIDHPVYRCPQKMRGSVAPE